MSSYVPLAVGLASVCAALAVCMLGTGRPGTDAEPLVDLAVQASAAFAGAYGAFALQRARDNYDEKARRLTLTRHALFALKEQHSYLLSLTRQVLDAMRANPLRHVLLHPADSIDPLSTIDANGLSYLLDRDGKVLDHLVYADHCFKQVSAGLAKRNATHEAFQRRAEEIRAQFGPAETSYEGLQVKAPSLVAQLRDRTNALYDLVDMAFKANQAADKLLRGYAARTYPGEHIFSVVVVPQSQLEAGG